MSASGRRLGRRVAALAAAFLLLGLSAVAPLPGTAPASAAPLSGRSVAITVLDVTPNSPASSQTPEPLTFRLHLHNSSDQALSQVTIGAVRGDPISGQQALDSALANPPTPNQAETIVPTKPVSTPLGPRGDATVTFSTTTDRTTVDAGLCLCQDRIYPIVFTATSIDQNSGASTVIGTVQTVLPSFGFTGKPAATRVAWLWPLIDRPHRVGTGSVFLDDDLASSVQGGRLDRMLRVLQNVAGTVTMTVVLDPGLLAELETMAKGDYVVKPPGSTTKTAGTGRAAAARWLLRLRTVLHAHPDIEVALTPAGDPDVTSLVAHGFTWTSPSTQAVMPLLGGTVPSAELAWPSSAALDPSTLDQLAQRGARAVIVNDTDLGRARQGSPRPDALAPLQTSTGPITAGVLSSSVQRYVAPVLSLGGPGTAQLPQLVSELAVRAAEQPTTHHFVLVAAPRDLDPSVATATRAIKATAAAFWSTSVSFDEALQAVKPVDQGTLTTAPGVDAAGLADTTVALVQRSNELRPALNSMLSASDATALLGDLPAALQQAESAAWERDPAAGRAFAAVVDARLDALQHGVFIVTPATRNYTLASSTSPLPVTVENDLRYPVTVRVQVSSIVAGFRADTPAPKRIGAGEKLTLHVPTHTDRTGRFDVRAVLSAPNGVPLDTVPLTVHSTALGVIGIVITIVSGSLLVIALLVRYRKRAKLRAATRAAATQG